MHFGMCNEHFDRPLGGLLERLAHLGFDGVEITP